MATRPRRGFCFCAQALMAVAFLASCGQMAKGDLQQQYEAHFNSGQLVKAEATARQGLASAEATRQRSQIIPWLDNLAAVLHALGRYNQAEPLYQRSIELESQQNGPQSIEVALTEGNLANLYVDVGRWSEAERLLTKSLATRERISGKISLHVATSLNNLAKLRNLQGRLNDAEQMYRQSLAIRQRLLPAQDLKLAQSFNNLGVLYTFKGQYADAESHLRRSLSIYEQKRGKRDPLTADCLNNLALLFGNQGRYADAEQFSRRALEINQAAIGEHPKTAMNLTNLASAQVGQNRFAEAAESYRRALKINEAYFGLESPDGIKALHNLAGIYQRLGSFEEAANLYQRALRFVERTQGADHPTVGQILLNIAILHREQRQFDDALRYVDRAEMILKTSGMMPELRFRCHALKAELLWQAGKQVDASAELNTAIALAETQRSLASGSETERAKSFAFYRSAYETMIHWRSQQGDVGEAFAAAERSRARSLIDQMKAAQIDLLAGLPVAEASALRRREMDAQTALAALEKRWELLPPRRTSTDAQKQEADELQAALVSARQELMDAYVAVRNASPAYRQMVSQEFRPCNLQQVQSQLTSNGHMLLEYVIGEKESYLITIGPGDRPPKVKMIEVDLPTAKALQISTGSLNAGSLRQALIRADGTGALQLLRQKELSAQLKQKLAALWTLLVPAAEQAELVSTRVKQLDVIPDGLLTMLPFESLLVEQDDDPQYLLDVGIPIIYAPSATLLFNQSQAKAGIQTKSALSVGDAAYGQLSAGQQAFQRGQLSALPHSGVESIWVEEIFQKSSVPCTRLEKSLATEAKVRQLAVNQAVLHFACHGIVEQDFGNMFGALAFTPGPQGPGNSADDGFLTLGEIYELSLPACELAILSACETNVGPEQAGEGVWALSRGFLVAGSRRVVASNWLVDDEAAASLVSYFCSGIAKADVNSPADYAVSLHAAKQWVRKQAKWQSPYYWATFVLIGPN